ncbi:YggS family pyridoxal phosphate-dependent enzyme [Silvimonas sp. JCM 19000]
MTTASLAPARAAVLERIAQAAHAAQRDPASVHLLAVSKTFSAADVAEQYALGQRSFGENYVQELVEKHAALIEHPDLEWHFIGPLQRNKTRLVAERAHWVHTIDRLVIAERLSEQRPAALPPLQVCVQINVSGEASKSGVEPAAALELAHAVARLPRLQLRGLMAIPEPTPDHARLATQFAALPALLKKLNAAGLQLDTLSMGMSADLELAIAHGATVVRVGTALFGARPAKMTA